MVLRITVGITLLLILTLRHTHGECTYSQEPAPHFFHKGSTGKTAIIALHGGRESTEKSHDYCTLLKEILNEYDIYSIDFGTKNMGKDAIDNVAKIAIKIKAEGKEVVIIGTSFGAFLSFVASSMLDTKKVIMIGGFTKPTLMYEIALKQQDKYAKWLELIPSNLKKDEVILILKKYEDIGSNRKVKRLFIHGLRDDIVPLSVLLSHLPELKGENFLIVVDEEHDVNISNPFIKKIIRAFLEAN